MDSNVLFKVHSMQQYKLYKQTITAFMIIIIQRIDILQNIISVSSITMYPETQILWQLIQSTTNTFISLAVVKQTETNQ
jgi:hypothetical protein